MTVAFDLKLGTTLEEPREAEWGKGDARGTFAVEVVGVGALEFEKRDRQVFEQWRSVV